MLRVTSLLCAGLVGATLASQAPEFMQQYQQRLGGAIDELARVVRHFDTDARTAGLTREAAIQRFDRAGDPFLRNRGRSMEHTISRWHSLSDHWRSLDAATALSRLPKFVAGLDTKVFERTWQHYRPAVPTTLEGLLYSGGGFLVTHTLFAMLLSLFRRRGRRVRREALYHEPERVERRAPRGRTRRAIHE